MEITLEKLLKTFGRMKSWEDRYKLLIEIGRKLPPMPAELKVDENYVHGCSSRVWMVCEVKEEKGGILEFIADSDSHIVKGLVAVLMIVYSGKTPEEILKTDVTGVFTQMELQNHLSPTRANGFQAMVKRIKALALTRIQKAG